MNKEELRSLYKRLCNLTTIKDSLDLFDIYLEFLWNLIRDHHKDPVYNNANRDAKIVGQMMFSKLIHLRKLVEGVGYCSSDYSTPVILGQRFS